MFNELINNKDLSLPKYIKATFTNGIDNDDNEFANSIDF